MSMYMTELQFAKWVEHYHMELIARDEFVAQSFGAKNKKRRGVILINTNNGKVARSYCHPDDKWDYQTGLVVAYAHYMGIEVPQVDKSYFIENLVGKEVILPATHPIGPTVVFVTPYTKFGFVLAVDCHTGNTVRLHPHTQIQERNIKK